VRRLNLACQDLPYWELVCDHTDAGDPWCIIYDRWSGRTALHIARIDRRYVIVCPLRQMSAWTATIQSAIEFALREIDMASCRYGLHPEF
jgi:hypothetical protein